MTREAKIGMLTGLGVIVLIGVLLSEYLGGGAHPMGTNPTGRMAQLPMGQSYRDQVTQPTGVPVLAAAVDNGGSSAPAPTAPSMDPAPTSVANTGTDASGAPRMDNTVAMGPAVNQPVAPVPAGTIQMDAPQPTNVPTMQLSDNNGAVQAVYVPGQPAADKPTQATGLTFDPPASAKPVGTEYVIAPSDTLAKIAKKFYKSSKSSDIARIVAANPTVLKNDKTMLIAGKKLLIPTLAAATPTMPEPNALPGSGAKKPGLVIRAPGTASGVTMGGSSGSSDAKPASAKIYVVKDGDSLEKIAKRIAPSKVSETVKKIMAANGIKDAKSLQVGMKLKLPV